MARNACLFLKRPGKDVLKNSKRSFEKNSFNTAYHAGKEYFKGTFEVF